MKAAALLFVPLLLAAQSGPRHIQVPVWTNGEALTPETLKARIDREAAEVVAVQPPGGDLMLLVVLDLTDDLAAVVQARTALIEGLTKYPANHFAGVLHAQNDLRVLMEPTPSRESSAAAIRSHPVGGRAGLLNTIEQTARLASSIIARSGVRVAVLYLTDSNIENYREAYTDPVVNNSDQGDVSRRFSDVLVRERISRIAAALESSTAPIFIAQLTYRTDRLNVAYQTGLISLAGATGGTATISRSIAEIPLSIQELLDRIQAHFSVTLTLPQAASKKVTLSMEAGSAALTYRTDHVLGE